jgi:hypothetical protein
MNGQDLYLERSDKEHLLNVAIRELSQRGRAFAAAERDYRVALAQKMLMERENKIPVTIISDICRGNPEIAALRFERDVAEAMYKSALEAINAYKLQIRIIESQIDREWSQAQ